MAVGQTADRFLRALVAASPIAMIAYDPEGRVMLWNPAAERLFGWASSEAVGRLPPFVAAEQVDEFLGLMRRALAGETWNEMEIVRRHRDGTPIQVRASTSAIRDEAGTAVAIVSLLEDMSEQRRLERELGHFFTLCPDLLCVVDSDGRFRRANQAWTDVLGYPVEEVLGQRYLDLVHPDDLERTAAQGESAEREALRRPFVNRYRARDGSYRWLLWSSAPDPERGLVYAAARDVTEVREAEERVEQAREAAERASQEKSKFLSRMSHELRTPLNAILGFSQLLELEGATESQAESIGQILKAGRHLLELINEVLDITRIEAGRLQLSPEPVEVSELAREAIELLQPVAVEQSVHLTLANSGPPLHVIADRQRLKQVLLNLIANGIKYNRDGGNVDVSSMSLDGRRVRIAVRDTGIGVAPTQIARLFDPFDRLGADTSGIEGTGLGLALSKGLVEAMDGEIQVESTVGVGSTFTVELPATESQLERAEPDLETIGETTTSPELIGETRTIVYIEDNLSNLRLIERVLAQHTELRLLSAMQAGLGIELAREHHPDVILLDLHLPDMNGEEALLRLRGDERTAATPVVIISADATPGQIERLLGLGAHSYLTKPLDLREFLKTLETVLGDGRGD